MGREKVAVFVAAVGPQGAGGASVVEHELNGQPAIVVSRAGEPFTAILLAVVGDRIGSVFIQADIRRLRRVARTPT